MSTERDWRFWQRIAEVWSFGCAVEPTDKYDRFFSRDRCAFAFRTKHSRCVYNVSVSLRLFFFDCSASQMEALKVFETSVAIYQST